MPLDRPLGRRIQCYPSGTLPRSLSISPRHGVVPRAKLASVNIACVAWFWAALSAGVRAHDPPHGSGVFQSDTRTLLRSNRGLLTQSDPNGEWRLLCNEALAIETYEVPSIVARTDGRWLIGTSHGLLVASPDLCTLAVVAPLASTPIGTLLQAADDASLVYASSARDNGGNGLYESRDNGETFSAYGAQTQAEMWLRMQFGSSDPQRIYASGRIPNPAAATGYSALFGLSNDRGQHFTQTAISIGTDEYGFELLGAVDGTPAAIYGVVHAYLGTLTPDRALVSHDSGQHWDTLLETTHVDAFAMRAADGVAWVGSGAGLWRIDAAAGELQQVQTQPVFCLSHEAGALYVCDGEGASGGLAISRDDGMSLERSMRFSQVVGLVNCPPASDVARSCQTAWSDWQRELPPVAVPDAGAADGGKASSDDDAGSEPPPPPMPAAPVPVDRSMPAEAMPDGPAGTTPAMPSVVPSDPIARRAQAVEAELDASVSDAASATSAAAARSPAKLRRSGGCSCGATGSHRSAQSHAASALGSALVLALWLRRKRWRVAAAAQSSSRMRIM